MSNNIALEIGGTVSDHWTPSPETCRQWIEQALLAAGFDKHCEISLRFATKQESATLNRRYRSKEYASNVLSFPANMPEAAVDASGSRMLGDIALCPEVIEAEARQQGKALEAHWAHLTIHGALHLMGHHHSEAEAAAAMEAIETESLKKLGFPDPYLVV